MSNDTYLYAPAPIYAPHTDAYYSHSPHMSDAALPLASSNQYAESRSTLVRTPSPTPSEIEALNDDRSKWWRKYLDLSYWKDWRHMLKAVLIVLIIGLVIAFSIFSNQIVNALHPVIHWMKNLRAGWLIPIAIFIIISFPPLFGHEILAILCGLVWGLGIGIAIVTAGVLLGEIANFFTFKYSCKTRSAKLEKKSIFYAALSQVVREGGIKIALIVRYSAVPSHFATVVFATCGMNFLTFIIATVLSLPQILVQTFIGVSLAGSSDTKDNKLMHILNIIVVIALVIITYVAMRYVKKRLREAMPAVIHARRKARQFEMTESSSVV